MDDLMLASTIRLAALPELIRAWRVPADQLQPTLMLLESMPRHKIEPRERQDLLRFALFQPDLDVVKYRSGRIFHEHGELRWEGLNSDEVQVVYTGTSQYQCALPESESRELDDSVCRRAPGAYFLFGKRLEQDDLARIGPAAQAGDFAEVRIPRLLRYPRLRALEGAERVQIALYEYLDLATGTTLAYRFRTLVPFYPRKEQSEQEEKQPV